MYLGESLIVNQVVGSSSLPRGANNIRLDERKNFHRDAYLEQTGVGFYCPLTI